MEKAADYVKRNYKDFFKQFFNHIIFEIILKIVGVIIVALFLNGCRSFPNDYQGIELNNSIEICSGE